MVRQSINALLITLAVLCFNSRLVHSNSTTAADEVWNFRVLLDDDPIGMHRFEITRQQNVISVHSTAQFDVRFLFIPVYSYQHEAREHWQDGCLVAINSSTDDNGDLFTVNSSRQEQKLLVTSGDSSTTLEGCVRSFAYWDLDLLNSGKLLNAQTGAYETVDLTDLGETRFSVDGTDVSARHYKLIAKDVKIDLWYTAEKRWLALESTTSSGAVLRYLPQTTQSQPDTEL